MKKRCCNCGEVCRVERSGMVMVPLKDRMVEVMGSSI